MNVKVNRDRLKLLTGAAGVVLGPDHPTTQALARAITTWGGEDVKRARALLRQLDNPVRLVLEDMARRVLSRHHQEWSPEAPALHQDGNHAGGAAAMISVFVTQSGDSK